MPRLTTLDDVLFPVEEVPVYANVPVDDGSRLVAIPDKKAIINTSTDRVLGVVGRDYRIVTNRQALDWALECCRAVFPQTVAAEWDVSATDAPSTGGHCRIDLVHRSAALDFGEVRPGKRPDAFGPFIRVSNSYNGLLALSFDIGFLRKVCRNGLIVPETIISFSVSHQRRHLRAGIHFKVADGRLQRVQGQFLNYVETLRACKIARSFFEPILHSVLVLRPLKSTRPGSREAEDWKTLTTGLSQSCDRYVGEIGSNAYALLNAMTDFASAPPMNRHLHRDKHGLQRLAGNWLAAFTTACREPQFSIEQYLKALDKAPSRQSRFSPN